MCKKVVLLAGRIKSGKDFAADTLVKNNGFVKLAFASSLKEFASKKYGIPLCDFHTQEGKSKMYNGNTTYRDLLINLASSYRKNDNDFFVNRLASQILTEPRDIVISDFRYPNEYDRLKEILPPGYVIKKGIVVGNNENVIDDPSENSLVGFGFDFVVYNFTTAESVHEQLMFHI